MKEDTSVRYRLVHQDAHCGARVGVLETPRGDIDLPTFMPVGGDTRDRQGFDG